MNDDEKRQVYELAAENHLVAASVSTVFHTMRAHNDDFTLAPAFDAVQHLLDMGWTPPPSGETAEFSLITPEMVRKVTDDALARERPGVVKPNPSHRIKRGGKFWRLRRGRANEPKPLVDSDPIDYGRKGGGRIWPRRSGETAE